MKWLPLSRGAYAAVDDEDYEELSKYKWSLKGNGYAHRSLKAHEAGPRASIMLHQAIMNPGPGQIVDHINRVKIDNRRCNLRICTVAENQHNSGPFKNSRVPYKGVTLHRCGKYRACITPKGKWTSIGFFDNPEEAARAYDAAARQEFGPHAFQNFPVQPHSTSETNETPTH